MREQDQVDGRDLRRTREEIELLEADHLSQAVVDPPSGWFAAEMLRESRVGESSADFYFGIAARPRLFERTGRDVGGEQLDIPTAQLLGEAFPQNHGDAIGFLAG